MPRKKMLAMPPIDDPKVLMDRIFSKPGASGRTAAFREGYAKRKAEEGTDSVWLVIQSTGLWARKDSPDGARDEKGYSVIVAISTRDQAPVTWKVKKAVVPDAETLKGVVSFLGRFGISVRSALVDLFAATPEMLATLSGCGIEWIAAIPSGVPGAQEMMRRHAAEIRQGVRFDFPGVPISGVADMVKVFPEDGKPSCMVLAFDSRESQRHREEMSGRLWSVLTSIRNRLPLPIGRLELPEDMEDLYTFRTDGKRVIAAEIDYEAWQRQVDRLGYVSFASSREAPAREIVDEISRMAYVRDQFLSHVDGAGVLGFDLSEEDLDNRFLIFFISSSITTGIAGLSREKGLNPWDVLESMRDVTMERGKDGKISLVQNNPEEIMAIMDRLGIEVPPEVPAPAKRRPGRPKGSGSRTAAGSGTAGGEPVKRPRGRPRGSGTAKAAGTEAAPAEKPEAAAPEDGSGGK